MMMFWDCAVATEAGVEYDSVEDISDEDCWGILQHTWNTPRAWFIQGYKIDIEELK